MTDAKLTEWLDAYFKARPQLQRPERTMLGYVLPDGWKPVVESLFSLVDEHVIEAALEAAENDDDDGMSALDRSIEHDLGGTDVDLYGKASNAIQERVDQAIADRTGFESHIIYSAFETNALGYPIDNLDEVAFEGTFIVAAEYDEFWDRTPDGEEKGKLYINKEPLTNPTWLDLAVEADKAVKTTHDSHHVFFEGANKAQSKETPLPFTVLQLAFGS